jgi:hypothetical protein
MRARRVRRPGTANQGSSFHAWLPGGPLSRMLIPPSLAQKRMRVSPLVMKRRRGHPRRSFDQRFGKSPYM